MKRRGLVGGTLAASRAHLTGWVLLVTACHWPLLAQQKLDLPKAEVRMHNGTPTLFINGQPNAGLTFMTYTQEERRFAQFGEIGVDLASFRTTANYNIYDSGPPVWVSRDKFDFRQVDKWMETVLRVNPDAWILPRVYLSAPPWWAEENPDELMRNDDGTVATLDKAKLPSWSSQKWREDAGYCLKRFIEHVRSQPYGQRVIGYMVAGGCSDEWCYWSRRLDYSKPHLEGFKRWLRAKYGTIEELRRRWHNDAVTFDTVQLPSWEERTKLDYFQFRDPSKSRHVIDYYDYTSDDLAEAVMYFSKVVKEATNRESLAGAFFGYLVGSRMYYHLDYAAFHKFLSCPDIDFAAAPTSYAWREAGTGWSSWRTVYESVRVHGKLWFDENEYGTHLLPLTPPYTTFFHRPADFPETEGLQLRQLANQIVHGAAAWWFNIGGPDVRWYDSPEVLGLIKKLNAIGERSIHFDRGSAAEIAVVVDAKSLLAAEVDGGNILYRESIFDQNYQLGRIGAPFDWLLIEDLEEARPYKMYVFLNVYHPTAQQKAMIKRLPSRGAKAVVFGYGAGFVADDKLDSASSSDLTGIRIAQQGKTGPLLVKMNALGAKMLPGVTAAMTYGTNLRTLIGPLIYADDPSAEVLGLMLGHGVPGLVSKEIGSARVYYSGAPLFSSPVLRGIAARAGVHIYNFRDEVTYVNRKFLAIHTAEPGGRQIRLPRATDVYDVYKDKVIAKQTDRFSVDLPVRHTVLYFLGSAEEWKGQ